jgi:hypothetical protein
MIVIQEPAKSTKSTAILCSDQRKHKNYRCLCSNLQDPKQRQLAHSARDRAGQLIVVQVPATTTTNACSDQRKHVTHRRLCSNSQFRQRQQLAHGAWNRAGQSIVVQVPAKSTTTTATNNKRLFRQT